MSEFRTYWDLSEKERAALESADVERYLDAELMTKGVLKVRPLETAPEPTIVEPAKEIFFRVGDICFATADQAHAFAELKPLSVACNYLNHDTYERCDYVTPLDTEVKQQRLTTRDNFEGAKSELQRRAAARGANEKARKEREKAIETQAKVLDGVWADWHECRALDRRHRDVIATFEEYEKITGGDKRVASKFLAKAFNQEQIEAAAAWCGVEIPAPEPAEYRTADATPPAAPADMPF